MSEDEVDVFYSLMPVLVLYAIGVFVTYIFFSNHIYLLFGFFTTISALLLTWLLLSNVFQQWTVKDPTGQTERVRYIPRQPAVVDKNHPLSGTCHQCGQQAFMPYTCSYCNQVFCPDHRLPEAHECDGIKREK